MIRPSQIRAARALVGLSQSQLAKTAGVGLATIQRIEGAAEFRGNARTLDRLKRALEGSGVVFIEPDDANGSGVRFRERKS